LVGEKSQGHINKQTKKTNPKKTNPHPNPQKKKNKKKKKPKKKTNKQSTLGEGEQDLDVLRKR